jgi:hypothetical protein
VEVLSLALSIVLPALFVAGGVTPARSGEAIALRVEFDAPADCASADAFYEGVLSRMPQARRASPGEDAVRLGVRLTRVGNKVRGQLRLIDAPGDADTRTVDGASCDEVVEVLSLTAALALAWKPTRPPVPPRPPPTPAAPRAPSAGSKSGTSSASATGPSSPATSAPEPEATPEPPAPPPPPPPPPPPATELVKVTPPRPPEDPSVRRYRVALGARGVAAGVMSPSVSFGGAVDLRLGKLDADGLGPSLGVSFLYVPNDFLRTADDARVRWTALALTACPGWSAGRVASVEPCAQLIGGWLDASGLGVSNPQSVERSWWSVGALLRVAARLGWGFSLELEAGLSVPLIERRFIFTTPERTVGETPTIAPIVGLGIARVL